MLFKESCSQTLVYVMYSVLAPASLKYQWKECINNFLSCYIFYCFLETCEHSNIICPQNCPIWVTSQIRSLKTPVSFKSVFSKIFSRTPNNGTITDCELSLRKIIFTKLLIESSWCHALWGNLCLETYIGIV